MHPLAAARFDLGGAYPSELLPRAGAPIGQPTIPASVLAGVVRGPDTPALVDDPTALRRAGPPGERRHRSPRREVTCRSPS